MRWGRICILLTLGFYATPGKLWSQPNSEATVAGLRLRVERSAQDRQQLIERALAQGQVAEALGGLERLRQEDLVPTQEGAVAGTVLADRILRSATFEQQSVLQTGMLAQARLAWSDWQQAPSLESLQAYCRRFGSTPAGVQAWCRLGTWFMDDRHWQQAAMVWQTVRRHPQSTRLQRDLAERCGVACQEQLAKKQAGLPSQDHRDGSLAVVGGPPVTRPSFVASGIWDLSPPTVLHEAWSRWLQNLRAQGGATWTASQPVVLADRVLIRHCRGLTALDRQNFKPVWQIPVESWDWLENNPGYLDNGGFRQTYLEQFGRKQLSDHLTQNVNTDGQRVYMVLPRKEGTEPGSALGPFSGNVPREALREPYNYLAAYDVASGQLSWRIGGESAGPTYPFGEVYFCSLPCVVDNIAFVIGQQQAELLLFAIHVEHGDLLWKLTLGDTPRSLAADPARQRIDCCPRLHQGLLYCPTASGAMIAVDPLTRSIAWVYRYEIAARETMTTPRSENTSFLRDVWWEGWRKPQLQFQGDIGVLTSPESDQLLAFAATTGQRLWSQPRSHGLETLAPWESALLVQEQAAVRSHDWQTGQVFWRTELDEFTGHGAIAGDHLVLPLQEGATQRLRIHDGKAGSVDWPGRDLGHLTVAGPGWVSTSLEHLTLWPDLNPSDEHSATDNAVSPAADQSLWNTARWHFSQGDWKRARSHLAGLTAEAATELRRLIAREELRETGVSPLSLPTAVLRPQSNDVHEVEDVLIQALTLVQQGQQPQAIDLLLQTLQKVPRQGTIRLAGPERFVRPDLAIIGLLTELWEQDRRDAGQVHQQLLKSWSAAQANRDPFALPKLADMCQPMAWTDEAIIQAGQSAFLGQSLISRELRLLKAAQNQDPEISQTAGQELARQLQEAGFDRDALDYLRLSRNEAGRDLTENWPARLPEIERKREQNHNVHFFPVPLDLGSTPFFDRLDVSIERLGQRIRLAGAGQPGTWEVSLPPLPFSFRYLQQHVAGWGRGRVLVLRVGFELFGLAPVDDRGDPAAKVLWHLDTRSGAATNPDQLRLEVLPAIPGIREDDYQVVDTFGHVVAQVGPVGPESLCYTDQGQLVSIDLQTGLRRWVRSDLPPGTIVTGDAEFVWLCMPRTQRIECLRAVDGATVSTAPCPLNFDRVIRLSDGLAWSITAGDAPRLICTELRNQSVVWQQTLSVGSGVAMLDDQHIGWVSPQGTLTVLESRSGKTQATQPLDAVPAAIDRIISARDGDLWFLAISARVPQQAGLQQSQLRGGFRAPFMSGTLVTLHRNTQRVLWQRPLEREPFSADQPRAVPVLMQNFKNPPADLQSGQLTDGVVRLINKTTGEVLLEHRGPDLMGYAALSADRPRGVIHLALERELIQLWYAPRPPAPALPDEE